MKTLKDLLLEEGFSDGFYPEETHGQFKDFKDDQLGKGGYIYEETVHQLGTIKRFVFKIWSSMDRYKTITEYPEGFKDNDLKKWKSIFDKDSYKILEAIEAKHGRAALDAEALIRNSKQPTRAPAYLRDKGLSTVSGYLVDAANAEVMHIPLYGRSGKLCSVQTIFPDGTKQFLPGGKIQGSYGVIEGDASTLYFCEGFATAATVNLATGCRVCFVLSADNYIEGIVSALARYNCPIKVIACDDDRHLKDNKGFNKAFTAANRFNCVQKTPIFKAYDDKNTTDFDDLRRIDGIETVTKQLEVTREEKDALAANEGVFPLGHDDSIYYFTSTRNESVQGFQTLGKDNLFKLMPESWWERRYGEASSKGDVSVPWDSVSSELYDACHAVGKFSADKIRGVGVYDDDGRSVVHLGDRLLVDGKEVPLRGFRSSYTYFFDHKMPPIEPVGLDDKEAAILWDTIQNFTLKEDTSKYHLGGWMVCAVLAGSLKWRPHLYVTGEKGAGKSTVLHFMHTMLDKGFKSLQFSAPSATATGIRQDCSSAAISVIVDEIEGDSKKITAKVEDFLTLFRVASSNTGARTVVGTPGQKAIKSIVSFCGVLGGIIPQIKTDQDKSRFAVIEFMANTDPEEGSRQWTYVSERMAYCQTEEFSRKFTARIIINSKIILKNIDVLTSELMKIEQARLAQQYGALLGASLALVHTQPISEKEISFFKDLVKNKDSAIQYSAESTSMEDVLDTILSAEIFDEDNKRTTIRRELSRPEQSDRLREIIGEYGVVISELEGLKGVHIRDNLKIKKQLNDMPMFSTNYMAALRRLKGVRKSHQVFFQGKRYRGVWVPMDLIIEPEPDKIGEGEQF